MGSSASRLTSEGRAALAAGDVSAARAAYEQAALVAETGDVLAGLAEVTYREVDFPAASALYGRAFAAFQGEDRPLEAARVARTLAYQFALHGDDVLMSGWIERARRLVADPDHVEGLWVELFDALGDPDLSSRERRLRSLTVAASRDRNLDCDARALLGKLYVDTGRLAEGMALLDETLTAVAAGEVDEYVVVEGALCLMLGACEATQDVDRAERWTAVGEQLTRESGLGSLGPLCRGYWGGVLIAAGRYAEAEEALSDTVRRLEHGYAYARDSALVRLAELRLRQGEPEAAEELLRGVEEHPEAAYPHAALLLARGETARARDRAERAVAAASGVTRGRLLALLVELRLASDDLGGAATAAEELAELAAGDRGNPYLVAASALARGRVCLAGGSASGQEPAVCLREALTGFARARMPLELASARLELARAVAEASPEVAVAEASLAHEGFELLAARGQADAAASLLRALGAPVRRGPRTRALLTAREQEVLDLIGRGLSNPEIAERLVISRKTVEHHVSRVLAKLGLRNRAEAAARAVRERSPG
jgi:DNA-binding CsgD family transcriptional regulator